MQYSTVFDTHNIICIFHIRIRIRMIACDEPLFIMTCVVCGVVCGFIGVAFLVGLHHILDGV